MASGRYKGKGRVTGSIVGKDKNWLSEGRDERRFHHVMDFASKAIDQTSPCNICDGTAQCHDAAVTVGYGAVSFWTCKKCGCNYTRSITPKRMAEYYLEDSKKATSNPQDGEA